MSLKFLEGFLILISKILALNFIALAVKRDTGSVDTSLIKFKTFLRRNRYIIRLVMNGGEYPLNHDRDKVLGVCMFDIPLQVSAPLREVIQRKLNGKYEL